MSIRTASVSDIPAIVEMCRACHDESPVFSYLSFSGEKVAATMNMLITEPCGAVFIAEKNGQIIGFSAVCISSHWSSDDPIAEEEMIYIRQEHRGGFAIARLIAAMNVWAEINGAKYLFSGCITGIEPEKVGRLYERMGFTPFAVGLQVKYR